ncbi:BTB/POZ domain-containing protein 6-A-like [Phthorimaea operculella]|nr:BTB/POZ domain-containing protein 6-A-like [Phthorimaea operculella]
MCIAYIQANISLDNVTAILNYPEYMQDQELMKSALKLFCEHADYLLKENKEIISPSCFKLILESNQMNIKEKDLIDHVFDWTVSYCEQHHISITAESRRDILKSTGLFQLLRFFTLTCDELDEICTSKNNLLLPADIDCIKYVLNHSSVDNLSADNCLSCCKELRNSLKLHWHRCYRSPLRSVAPIMIDADNHTVHCRLRSSKPVFITSLCIPTRMAPILNFRNDAAKVYSEQISVSVVDESDNNVIKFTNFMNTVEYDSIVDIELSEPCFVKKDKWYKVSFGWPQNRCITYSYMVEYRDQVYQDHRVKFEFEDISVMPGTSGSLLSGLKYCL